MGRSRSAGSAARRALWTRSRSFVSCCSCSPSVRGARRRLPQEGAELVTDWPLLFARNGFTIIERQDIIAETLPSWAHARAVYDEPTVEIVGRYGRRIAGRTREQIDLIAKILTDYGTVPVLSAPK
jgi:hypothetical protein